MHTMMQEDNTRPQKFSITDSNKNEIHFKFSGISMWGYIYKALNSPHMARLLPIEDVREKKKRVAIAEFKNRPRQPQIAPVTDTQQVNIKDQIFFFVCYEIEPDLTWHTLINSKDIITCLNYAVYILNALSEWWKHPCAGMIPTPQDIVFVDEIPFLLPLPFQGWPTLESLFQEPERIQYIAPEVLCSRHSLISPQNIDLYAVSVSILKCFNTIQSSQNADINLPKVANGTFLSEKCITSRLPFWMEQVDQIQKMRTLLFNGLAPDPRVRSIFDPTKIAQTLSGHLYYLKPVNAVTQLMDKNKPEHAFNLVQDILLEHNTYEMLLMGAQIASHPLNKIIEAISLFDQAIAKKIDNRRAYKGQLDLILENTIQVILSYFKDSKNQENVLSKIDAMVLRDFTSIPGQDQKQMLLKVGQYFIIRQQYEKTARIIYNYLFDGKTFLWWEFSRTLLYAEALIGMKRLDEVTPFLNDIKIKLKKVSDEQRIPPALINDYGSTLARLDILLFETNKQIANGNSDRL